MNLRKLDIRKLPFLKEGLVLTLFFAVTTITFNILFYTPSKKEISRLKSNIDQLNTEITGFQAIASSAENEYKRLQASLKISEEKEAMFNLSKDQIPSVKEVSSILNELSSNLSGLTLKSMKTSPIDDNGEYIKLPLVMEFQGGFQALGPYLTAIEKSRRLIGVEHIELIKDNNAGLSIRMELNIYLMKEGGI